jgi:hypothetical protein
LLPSQKERLVQEQRKLNQAIARLATEKKAVCEEAMTALLDQLVQERDSYLLAWEALCRELGTAFPMGRHATIPECRHPRIDQGQHGCQVIPLSSQERAAALAQQKKKSAEPLTTA